jgi:hypothetical protein
MGVPDEWSSWGRPHTEPGLQAGWHLLPHDRAVAENNDLRGGSPCKRGARSVFAPSPELTIR